MSSNERIDYSPCKHNIEGFSSKTLDKRCRRKHTCLKMVLGCVLTVNLMTISSVFYLWLQLKSLKQSTHILVEQDSSNDTITAPISEKFTLSQQNSGTFKMDQKFFEVNKTIRWIPEEGSSIQPEDSSPCLTIPVTGRYLIISRFTYKVSKNENNTEPTHNFKLLLPNGMTKDHSFKRKYVTLSENKLLNGDQELRKASVFIEFYNIKAEEKLCANTSAPDLLYASSLDNDITIIKF